MYLSKKTFAVMVSVIIALAVILVITVLYFCLHNVDKGLSMGKILEIIENKLEEEGRLWNDDKVETIYYFGKEKSKNTWDVTARFELKNKNGGLRSGPSMIAINKITGQIEYFMYVA